MERDTARLDTPPGGQPRERAFAPTKIEAARPPVGMWLALTLIALAAVVVKPWAPDVPGAHPGGGVAVTSGTPVPSGPSPIPTVRPDTAGSLVALFCLDPYSWRIATIERWRDQTIRVWRAIDPVARASGPDDPRIPIFPVVSEGVTELGWCAPVVGPDRPVGVATITVWRRTPEGSVAIRVTSTRATGVGSSFGGLYLPPGNEDGNGDGDASVWPDGGYVFRYREPDGRERWFAVEVELRPSTGTTEHND
jgi:hypothetical protein